MEQTVQCRGSHDGVARKDFSPVAKGFVRGEDDGAVVVVKPLVYDYRSMFLGLLPLIYGVFPNVARTTIITLVLGEEFRRSLGSVGLKFSR